MIVIGIFAIATLGLATAAARCPLGRAVAVGMRCVSEATHADLH
jgi:hypothetical protein